MKFRGGSVLGKKTILKSDHFPGCQNKRLSPQIDGAPNYRQVRSPSFCFVFFPTSIIFSCFFIIISSHHSVLPPIFFIIFLHFFWCWCYLSFLSNNLWFTNFQQILLLFLIKKGSFLLPFQPFPRFFQILPLFYLVLFFCVLSLFSYFLVYGA